MATPQTQNEADTHRRLLTARVLERICPVNRGRVLAQVEEQRNRHHRESSVKNFAHAVAKADVILGGKDFKAVTVDDARLVITAFRAGYEPNGLRARAIMFRMHVRWLYGVDRLDEQGSTCPDGKAIERALKVPRPRNPEAVGQVISREHQDLIADSFKDAGHSLNPAFPISIRNRWFTRGLKGLGHRVSEFCSVKLRGMKFMMMATAVNGVEVSMEVLWVDMDERAPDLKTGRRGVFTADPQAIEAAKDWLMCHPGAGLNERPGPGFDGARDTLEPDAPVNIRANCKRLEAIAPNAILQIVRKACRATGLDKLLPALLTPHDFRHTGATEDAIAGSTEADLRQKYGWGPHSKMPAIYVHLRVEHMAYRAIKNRVLMQGVAVTAQVVAAPVAAPVMAPVVSAEMLTALAGLLKQAAAQASAQPAAGVA